MKRILSLIVCFTLFLSIESFSQNYDVSKLKETNPSLFSFVTDWLGTRYKFGGISKSGIDCSAFTKTLYRLVFNQEIPRTAESQYRYVKTQGGLVKKDDIQTGDLVFFRTNTATTWHVGVYLEKGFFVHSSNSKTGVTISNLDDSNYKKQFLSAGKPIDKTDLKQITQSKDTIRRD
jgi:lipoprotein Spr